MTFIDSGSYMAAIPAKVQIDDEKVVGKYIVLG